MSGTSSTAPLKIPIKQHPNDLSADLLSSARGASEVQIIPSETDSPSPPAATDMPIATTSKAPMVERERFPHNLPSELNLVLGQNGTIYAVMIDTGNPYVVAVGSRVLNNVVRDIGRREGVTLRKADISDINHMLQAHAETAGVTRNVWYRVAPIEGGIEVDLGNEKHTRVRITAGKVETITGGSETLFFRSQVSQQMVVPADVGDLTLLRKHLNLHPKSKKLLIAWLSYTLAHPKLSTSKFVILTLQGGQGRGKTSLCENIILNLIDPSRAGVQIMPRKEKDLVVAAENAHVLCYDNVRCFSQHMADILCIAATGGALSSRQLYTDAGQQVDYLHVALVLNGIHSFVDQPDLAQRCLPIELLPIPENKRRSDGDLVSEFKAELPIIQRGLFDLVAEVLKHLPDVETTNPERMIDFVRWLAAMEKVDGVPLGIYQKAYSEALQQGQLDSLQDSPLAAAVLELAEKLDDGEWSGTPADLLFELNRLASRGTQRSREWPQNTISLSKRLRPLQAGLCSQGVDLEFSRGKHRNITINVQGGKYEK